MRILSSALIFVVAVSALALASCSAEPHPAEPADEPPALTPQEPDPAVEATPSEPRPEPVTEPVPDHPPVPTRPEWWHDDVLEDGSTVTLCVEAADPSLREARAEAVRAARRAAAEHLGAPPAEFRVLSTASARLDDGSYRVYVRAAASR